LVNSITIADGNGPTANFGDLLVGKLTNIALPSNLISEQPNLLWLKRRVT
jgi:hypothetical protein